jgi:hypothetical protein
MVVAIFYSRHLYNELELNKKQLYEKTVQLRADSVSSARQDSIIHIFSSKLKIYSRKYDADTSLGSIVNGLLGASDTATKFTNSTVYQQASQLEKDGFNALISNQFDTALDNFTRAEKISPSFHMAYEISKLLRNEKANFANPEKQKSIKKQIIEKFSWRSPPDLLNALKAQLKD